MAVTAVTPTGVRDGDPGALAGLCEVRGPAVLAYCEVVAGRGPAGAAAAAHAFGSFRAGVVATADLGTLNPEALLVSATRHAAARHAGGGLPAACSRVPALLAARADRSITLADHDFLEEHLAGCWTCRAPVARFEAADRAYLDPPSSIDAGVAAAIVAAMTAAAPVRGNTVDTPAIAAAAAYGATASANGHGARAETAAAHDLPPRGVDALDQPTAGYEMPAEDLAAHDPPPVESQPRRERRDRPRGRASLLGALGLGAMPQPAAAAMAQPAASAASPAAAAAAPQPAPTAAARARRPRREVRVAGAATPAPAAGSPTTARPSAGTSLPRPRRAAGSAVTGRGGANSMLRLAIVLPIVLVIFAIVTALAIAGVFGSGDPPPAPQSYTPGASEPSTTTKAPVVVVPGARDASAADVERAKARARAAKRQAATSTATPPAAGTAPAAGAITPAAPATGATTPPPPPATKAKPTGKGSTGTPEIDADNGATGAEQVPAAGDTSTVPELAPPVEPLDPPG